MMNIVNVIWEKASFFYCFMSYSTQRTLLNAAVYLNVLMQVMTCEYDCMHTLSDRQTCNTCVYRCLHEDKAVCHRAASVMRLGQMISMAASAATLLKWLHRHGNTHTHEIHWCKDVQKHNPLGSRAEERQHIYLVSLYYLFFLIHYLWIYQSLWHTAYRLWLAASLHIFPFPSLYASVCPFDFTRAFLCLWKTVSYKQTQPFFLPILFFSPSLVPLCHQTIFFLYSLIFHSVTKTF